MSHHAFNKWMSRPVYVVQCRTMRKARELCGLSDGEPMPIALRCVPKHRDKYTKALRGMVATSMKMDRLTARFSK